jgi:hypothetical protein
MNSNDRMPVQKLKTLTEQKRRALDRLLAIAPALERAGIEPVSEGWINAEIKAARVERRAAGG